MITDTLTLASGVIVMAIVGLAGAVAAYWNHEDN